jgi:molybdopterin-synthase adenylyltransferase
MAPETLNPQSPFFHEQRHASLGDVWHVPLTVCGAGALGGNLAETLARMGFTRLRLIDRDRVEARNLSSQPYGRGEVGAPKARALANSLYRAVEARVEAAVTELATANAGALLAGSALVVDAFDNHAARAAVSATANLLALPCLHIGFSGDGLYGSGVWEPGDRVPSAGAGDPCDYPLTRPFALTMAALAARAVVQFLVDGQKENFELTWGDLRISRD